MAKPKVKRVILKKSHVPRVDLVPRLRTFQKLFLEQATRPDIDTAALSLPRGNGKSWLAGTVLARILSPRSPLFVSGSESVLCAASIEQARIVFRFARRILENNPEYRFLDSLTRVGIVHKPTNTRLRILASGGQNGVWVGEHALGHL